MSKTTALLCIKNNDVERKQHQYRVNQDMEI
jgi:hypothetical protein